MAMENWRRAAPREGWPSGYAYPHVLTPRRYATTPSAAPYPDVNATPSFILQEGAFCESCFTYANDSFWNCEHCLDGAWGFCNPCVLRGHHCTHPLLLLAHISTLNTYDQDPSTVEFLPVPHLKPHSYILRTTHIDCNICAHIIPPADQRLHCYVCAEGDYDLCTPCYNNLIATGKISPPNGPAGWRRCLQNHRMAIIGFKSTPYGGGQERITIADPVGGWRLKEEAGGRPTTAPPPSNINSGVKRRRVAAWNRWPEEGSRDELAFPRNAEIREGEDLNEDWAVGVYAGRVGLFPSGFTRRV